MNKINRVLELVDDLLFLKGKPWFAGRDAVVLTIGEVNYPLLHEEGDTWDSALDRALEILEGEEWPATWGEDPRPQKPEA